MFDDQPHSQPHTVLLIDDQAIIGERIRQILAPEQELAFHYCADPAKALSTAIAVSPTAILVDLVMPGVGGLDLVAQFRAHEATRFVPLIVLSMKEDPAIKAEAFRCGANDYLVKLPSAIELIARLRYHSVAYLNASRSRAAFKALRESREQLQLRNDEIRRQRDTLARQARELTEANRELAEANTVKTYFAATMSHELRNVFAGIVGYGELLTNKIAEGEPLAAQDVSLIEQLRGRGQEGLDIITVTLELSRSEITGAAQDFQIVDLPAMLAELATELPAVHKKNDVAVTWRADADLSTVRSDPVKLRMILANLITNALKFTASGGRIELSATAMGDDVQLTVSDTGAGIPADALPTLFDPFRQAHGMRSRRAGGAGLGLYLVRKLVGMLEGSIDVQSEVDKGSVFRVLLREANKRRDNIVRTATSAREPAVAETRKTRSEKPAALRILVAEDTPVNQLLMEDMLTRIGHVCRVASNGREALEALAEEQFDVVLMDIAMPEMDGIEATRQIMTRFPAGQRPRIVALTAGTTGQERRDCEEAGMDDFVEKPFTIASLRAALGRVRTDR